MVARRTGRATLFFLVSMTLVVSCGGSQEQVDDAAARDPSLLPARELYRRHCSLCHGVGGRGSPRLYPPLRGSFWASGSPDLPILVVLHGIEGKLTLKSGEYMNRMQPLGDRLSDREIALILSYVRASWGNQAPPVMEEDVIRVRARYAERQKPWTQIELEELRFSGP